MGSALQIDATPLRCSTAARPTHNAPAIAEWCGVDQGSAERCFFLPRASVCRLRCRCHAVEVQHRCSANPQCTPNVPPSAALPRRTRNGTVYGRCPTEKKERKG